MDDDEDDTGFTPDEQAALIKTHGKVIEKRHLDRVDAARYFINAEYDCSHVGRKPSGLTLDDADAWDANEDVRETESGWSAQRRLLVAHYLLAVAQDEVCWCF